MLCKYFIITTVYSYYIVLQNQKLYLLILFNGPELNMNSEQLGFFFKTNVNKLNNTNKYCDKCFAYCQLILML